MGWSIRITDEAKKTTGDWMGQSEIRCWQVSIRFLRPHCQVPMDMESH